MSRRPIESPAPQLIAALLTYFGSDTRLLHAAEREWASATFSGARHVLSFVLPDRDSATAQRIAALPDHEFDLRRDIVADVSVKLRGSDNPDQRVIDVEILTVTAD